MNHVRDKNDYLMSSLKGISGSSVALTSFSVFCLFPTENLLLFFHVCFPKILCSELLTRAEIVNFIVEDVNICVMSI